MFHKFLLLIFERLSEMPRCVKVTTLSPNVLFLIDLLCYACLLFRNLMYQKEKKWLVYTLYLDYLLGFRFPSVL